MLREILRPTNRQLTIDIPQEYVDKEIEILILPFYEMESSANTEARGYDEKLMKLFRNAPNIKIDKNIETSF